jgi:hypothetical protein
MDYVGSITEWTQCSNEDFASFVDQTIIKNGNFCLLISKISGN